MTSDPPSTRALDLVRAIADVLGNTGDEERAARLVDAVFHGDTESSVVMSAGDIAHQWSRQDASGDVIEMRLRVVGDSFGLVLWPDYREDGKWIPAADADALSLLAEGSARLAIKVRNGH